MHQEPAPSAEVDICDACGGVWIDWFDGELHAVAAETEAARNERQSSSPRTGAAIPTGPTGSATAPATGSCPRCMRSLAADIYRFPDAARGELIDHVEILRCEECAGSFVPRPSARLLLDRVSSRPETASVWDGLVQLLRRLLG